MNGNVAAMSPWILDVLIGAVMLACACVKGARGLYKSLMPLAVILASAVCAMLLSALLTGPVTDVAYPMVESHVISAVHLDKIPEETVEKAAAFAASPEELVEQMTALLPTGILPLFSRLGVDVRAFLLENWEKVRSAETVQDYITPEQTEILRNLGIDLKAAAGEVLDATGAALDVEAALFSTAFSLSRRLTAIAVHFLLWCAFCTLFLVVFTMIVNTLGLAFRFPVIGWADKLGGAALGAVECGVVLFVLGWLMEPVGFTALREIGSGTLLYALFF